MPEPFVDLHPADAADLGIAAADLVSVTSPTGACILRARITDAVQRGQVFAPMHWTGETAPSARIDALVAGAVDPVSGQPESKAGVVALARYEAAWYGFAVSAGALCPQALEAEPAYWARARTSAGFRAELAGRTVPGDWEAAARALFAAPEAAATSLSDAAQGQTRVVLRQGERLIGALFVAPAPVAVMRDYLAGLDAGARPLEALAGRPPAGLRDPGPVLCACFSVGVNTILEAIETGDLRSVDQIGAALGAGTNCGSCRPELARLISRLHTPAEAAE